MQYLTTFRSTVYRSPDFNVVAEVVAEAKHQIEQNRVESLFSTKKDVSKKTVLICCKELGKMHQNARVSNHLILFLRRLNASKRHGTQPSHLIFLRFSCSLLIITSRNSWEKVTKAWMNTPVMTITTARPGIGWRVAAVAVMSGEMTLNATADLGGNLSYLFPGYYMQTFCRFTCKFQVILILVFLLFVCELYNDHLPTWNEQAYVVSQCHHVCKPYKTMWKLSAIVLPEDDLILLPQAINAKLVNLKTFEHF